MAQDWTIAYAEAWNQFVDAASVALRDAGAQPPTDRTIHDQLRQTYDVPYHSLKRLGKVEGGEGDGKTGSAAGFFVEGMLAAIVFNAVRGRCPNAKVARNSYGLLQAPNLPKEPDLFVSHCGRRIVVEVKAMVQSSTVRDAISIRDQYGAVGFDYYMIGGWWNGSKTTLDLLVPGSRWISILAGFSKVQADLDLLPSVDELLDLMAQCGPVNDSA